MTPSHKMNMGVEINMQLPPPHTPTYLPPGLKVANVTMGEYV